MRFCHVIGGVHNFNFHSYLSECSIRYYRRQGCTVKTICWEFL